MILLRDDKNNRYEFEITKFPDGTSQVWKINPEPKKYTQFQVIWFFENEAEIFHLTQLSDLLLEIFYATHLTLNVPYFPTARQDKRMSNISTFSRYSLISLLRFMNFNNIKTYDLHSDISVIESEKPTAFLKSVADKNDVICFPDKGAKERYANLVPDMPTIHCEKVRNQQTGEITGMTLVTNGVDIKGKKVLVMDDICDKGGTFIGVANLLKPLEPVRLTLAISHGLFTAGTKVLFDAGYNYIYTTNSLISNWDLPNIIIYDILGDIGVL